jgi:hypothetical protein
MTTNYSRRLRRARRSATIPVYQGIKMTFNKALPLQPEVITLVSVEEGVWDILADGRRVGGVRGDYQTVVTAARLLASKTGCELIYDSAYASKTQVQLNVLQFRVTKPIFITERWVKSITRDLQLASV